MAMILIPKRADILGGEVYQQVVSHVAVGEEHERVQAAGLLARLYVLGQRGVEVGSGVEDLSVGGLEGEGEWDADAALLEL